MNNYEMVNNMEKRVTNKNPLLTIIIGILLIVIIGLIIVLVTRKCTTDTLTITITGLDPAQNGLYIKKDEHNGEPSYEKEDGTMYYYYATGIQDYYAYTDSWVIRTEAQVNSGRDGFSVMEGIRNASRWKRGYFGCTSNM